MEKLIKIQKELKAPKNQFNKFGNYKYRSCEDILESVKPLLAKYKLWMTISDDVVEMGGRVYIKATAKIHDCETGEEVINTAFARESESKKGMDDSQITGSTSSYARKYALNGLFLIDDTRDADATNTHGKTEADVDRERKLKQMAEEVKAKPIDATKIKIINSAVGIVITGEQLEKTLAHYGVESIKDLNELQACEIIKRINELKGEK